jgi:hypothetical protein
MTFVNHRGETINPYQRAEQHPKPAPRKAEQPLKLVDDPHDAKVSQGFAVLGYRPGTPDLVLKVYELAVEGHARKPTAHRSPGVFEDFESRWYRTNKPQRVRSRPYELREAADECAQLAEKYGWTRVQVEELLRG